MVFGRILKFTPTLPKTNPTRNVFIHIITTYIDLLNHFIDSEKGQGILAEDTDPKNIDIIIKLFSPLF